MTPLEQRARAVVGSIQFNYSMCEIDFVKLAMEREIARLVAFAQAEIEACAVAAENEPELDDEMPDSIYRDMKVAIITKGAAAEFCRLVVRSTKQPIAAAIRARKK